MTEWTDFEEADLPPKAKVITNTDKVFVNNLYQVNLRNLPLGWVWLSIKRLDKEAIHDWRDLQLIKNSICGKEREALELYPAESRLVDSSNQYHLFVMPEGETFPFGYGDRLVVEGGKFESEYGWSNQRPFEARHKPNDVITHGEWKHRADKHFGGENDGGGTNQGATGEAGQEHGPDSDGS
jgi:hypothetical protein